MTWNECFKRYIERRFGENAQKKAADSLKRPKSSVHYWINGTLPRDDERDRIARWSKGEVPAELHVVLPHAKAG